MARADQYKRGLLVAASITALMLPSAVVTAQDQPVPVVEPEIVAETPSQPPMPAVPEAAPLTPEQQVAPAEAQALSPVVPNQSDATPIQDPGTISAPAAGEGTAAATPATQSTQASGTYESMDPKSLDDLKNSLKNMQAVRGATETPGKIGTLFFTLWQHSLLQDAKRLYVTRRPSDTEIAKAADNDPNSLQPIDKGIREISLGGILYRGDKEWVVWLNGMRMVPDALPKEVMDIKVAKTHIDLKWFDAYTNLIFPVRLRPHQRFNLDSRIFLPGLTAESAAKLQEASSQP